MAQLDTDSTLRMGWNYVWRLGWVLRHSKWPPEARMRGVYPYSVSGPCHLAHAAALLGSKDTAFTSR